MGNYLLSWGIAGILALVILWLAERAGRGRKP